MIIKLKINGVPHDYTRLPFGEQIKFRTTIENFKKEAKSTHLSQKRQTYAKAIREFIGLHGVTEFYCQFECSAHCKDDSFEFFYK